MRPIKVKKNWKLAFVGDIHEQEAHFYKLLEKINPSEQTKIILVSLGDVYDKGNGVNSAKKIINSIRDLYKQNLAYMIRGNHEQKHIKQARTKNNVYDELRWVSMQPVSLQFKFENNTYVTAIHGGITPKCSEKNLTEVNVMYLRNIDKKGNPVVSHTSEDQIPWGQVYDGRFGYMFCGHSPQFTGEPLFWPYACNVDTGCYKTGVLSCQIFSEKGLEDLIQIKNDDL